MWNNIGKKIKNLAKVVFWIQAVLAVIGYIIAVVSISTQRYVSSDAIIAVILGGLVALALLVLFFWLGSFLLCGFGQLVESSEQTAYNTYHLAEQNERLFQMHTNSDNLLIQIRDVNNAALQATRRIARTSAQQESGEKGIQEQ